MRELIVAVTGASGAVYARRLLERLAAAKAKIHLVVSPAGAEVMRRELGVSLDAENLDASALVEGGDIAAHRFSDITAPIASGRCGAEAMVIVPCSMNTLAAVANGLAGNLIERAAAVMLKEGRGLVLVPRETPLSTIHIRNMLTASQAGACVLPAMPGFYERPATTAELVDFIVDKILARIGFGEGTNRHR